MNNPPRKKTAVNRVISKQDILRYSIEFCALVLLASTERFGIAFALGFFAGLVYGKQNMLLTAPMLLIACLIFSFSWQTLVSVLAPIIALLILYFVFYKLRRNVQIYFVSLVLLAAMAPYCALCAVYGGDVFEIVLSLVIALVFSFCSQFLCYAVLLRRINRHYTLDEQICGGIVLAVFAYAFCRVSFYGFCLYFLIAGFIILLCSDCFSPAAALFASLLLGLGASVYFGDTGILAAAAVWGAAAVTLSSFTRFAALGGILVTDALLWLFTSYAMSGWKSLLLLGAGALIYALIPKRFRYRIAGASKKSSGNSLYGLVNRHRGELADKLYSVGDVFYDMSKNLERFAATNGDYSPEKLAREISKSYCARCGDREACFAQLGGDTSSVLEPMASAALNRGKVTILDMPPFITGRCSKMHNLASVINGAGEAYKKRKREESESLLSKRMMSEQFAGVALILDSLAGECSEQVSFMSEEGEALIAELLRHNIIASDAVITGEDAEIKAALTVRSSDADKAILPKIVSRRLRTKLEVSSVVPRGDRSIVHLESAPLFELAYGTAERKRSGEDVSGDSKTILCPSRRRRLFALSDGMGSGAEAGEASREAISMVENFYRANFDSAIMLSLINKLLGMGGNERFSSLDIAVIDTVSGVMDSIKLGSADSFIIRGDSIERIACSAPPAGILDKVEPLTTRLQLFDGDMVLMMSDGVFDALDAKGVTDIVNELDTKNPQTLADALLNCALDNGAEDDCTVLALRIFCA